MSTQDKARKTEPPTPRRLREARRKGRVVKSREVTSTAIIMAAMAFFYMQWPNMFRQFEEMAILSTTLFEFEFADALKRMLDLVMNSLYDIAVPFMLTVTLAGVIAHVAQFGVLLSFEPVKPMVERLNPVKGFGRIFSLYSLLETGKAAFKAVVILGIVAVVLYTEMNTLMRIPYCDVECERGVLLSLSGQVALYLVPFVVVLAMIDYGYQRRHFMREHRMSREEVRRERRDAEGAPELLGRRRQVQRETVTADAGAVARDATVLVTGRDLVVALFYDRNETPLPIVSLIARGDFGRAAVATALAQGVPVLERPELARDLAHDANEGEYIPSQLLRRTAELMSQLPGVKKT